MISRLCSYCFGSGLMMRLGIGSLKASCAACATTARSRGKIPTLVAGFDRNRAHQILPSLFQDFLHLKLLVQTASLAARWRKKSVVVKSTLV